MDGDWDEVQRIQLPPPGIHALPTPVTVMIFDHVQELFWVGNEYGRVSSFFSSELQRYTSFRIHPSADGPVRQILSHEKGIICLGSKTIHMASRRGFPLWYINHDDMKDMRCMSFTSNDMSEILVAGVQDTMFVIDVAKGEVRRQMATSVHFTLMKRSRYICASTMTGSVHILNSTTFSLIRVWDAYSFLINDMDAQHDFIVTCGYSARPQNTYILDPLVKVFDLRNMVSMPPLPFPSGAAYVRMHPRMLTTSFVLSQHGQIHIVDLMDVNTSNMRQANVLSYVNTMEIAPSGEAIVLADAECNIHLWGSSARMRFSDMSVPVEFAESLGPTYLEWDSNTPLSSIGMPYYRDQLMSSWPSHIIHEAAAQTTKHDINFLATMKTTEWGGYGRYNKTTRRNQVEKPRPSSTSPASLRAPKFLSEKARDAAGTPANERRVSDVADALGAAELSSLKADVPVMYRNVEIKYSKFGVDDFDFGFYNRTPFSGLEIHISNSYANPLLQIMHFTPILRNAALQHAASSCVDELCILCELGYLFDMLEKAEGAICQATNLLKTFSSHPQAGSLALLEEESHGTSLTTMLQGLNRFLSEKIAQDYKSVAPYSLALEQSLATSATTLIKCTSCLNEHTRPGSTFVNDLLYTVPNLRGHGHHKTPFSQILKSSIEREATSRGWCSRCQRYQSLATKRKIHNIPSVWMLNAAVKSPEAVQLWGTPGWLPEEIGIIVEQGQFFCYEGEDLRLHLQRGIHNITVYSLVGIAADIDSGQHQKTHLVSLVNVAHSAPSPQSESQWHLFNDFLVRPINKEEALSFNPSWKLPSVITYQIKSANNHIDDLWKQNLDPSVLYMDKNNNPGPRTYIPLSPTELPGHDTIIALDTEFVSIRQPEISVNSDGTRETILPTAYALARVSVLRTSGALSPQPFIDDYILPRSPIIDYLTSYSGIAQADLDPASSPHSLVAHKVAYKKLWVLLNRGCRFLGHGLKTDFRVSNLQVPKEQVVDTSVLFWRRERMRKLSLAFLAWVVLGVDVQLGGTVAGTGPDGQKGHDSIEDAETALKLYTRWRELREGGGGALERLLDDVYRVGGDCGFKPPGLRREKEATGGGGGTERPETPLGNGSEGNPASGGIIGGGGGGGGVTATTGPVTPVRNATNSVGAGGRPGSGRFGGAGAGQWTPGKGGSGGSVFGGSPLR